MIPLLTPLFASLALSAPPSIQAPAPPPAGALRARAPEDTVLWFESNALEPILAQGLDHPLIAQLLEEPLVIEALRRKGVNPAAGLRMAEAALGQSPLELAHALASGGVALGFLRLEPGNEAPFMMLRGLDLDAMEVALDDLSGVLTGLGVLGEVPEERVKELGRSVRRAWTLKKAKGIVAWTREGTLIFAKNWNDASACCAVSQRSEAIASAYEALARNEAPGTFAWFNLEALDRQVGLEGLRDMATDPGVHFVLGPAFAYLGQASSLAMDLDISGEAVRLGLHGVGIDAGEGSGSFPENRATRRPSPLVAGSVAEASLHRDLHFLLEKRIDLFPPRVQPGIAEGLGNFALLVGGPDALDELLASLRPTLRLASETIEFASGATPDVPLPGLTIGVNLEQPQVNGNRLTSAFQTAVTLSNVERAMNGEEGLRLGLESVAGVTVTHARHQPVPEGASVDISHNLEPACALVGDLFLLGTHGQPIANAVERNEAASMKAQPIEEAKTPWIPIDRLRLAGRPLHDILVRQRDLIVMNAMLEDGKTQDRAEAEADILIRLARRVGRIELATDWLPESVSTSATAHRGRSIRAGLTLHLLP